MASATPLELTNIHKEQSGPITTDPLLYYLSPLQLWLGQVVSLVNRTGTIENEWLPVFTRASAHLRSVFARIRSEHGPKAAFMFQWETGGMLLLSIALEVNNSSKGFLTCTLAKFLLTKPPL